MRFPVLLSALIALLLLACAPAVASATTYVDAAGAGAACSDARTAAVAASPATPWCSIATATAKAPSGSTVLVRAGSYPYTRIDGTNRARNTAMVTVKAYPGETPVVFAVDIRNYSYLRFEDLKFSGTMNLVYFGNDHIEFAGSDLTNAVNIRGSRDIAFVGNHFHDGPDSCTVDSSEAGGVRSMTGTQNLTIRGNRFERLTGDAVQMDGDGVLIEGNTFDHIQVRRGCSAHTDVIQSLGSKDVTIRGNVARDNDSGILNSSADHQTSGWTIENNVFVRSSGTPLQLDNQMDDLVVVNNTFAGSGVGVLFRWWTNPGVPVNSQGFVIANNIFGDGYSVDAKLNIAVADYNLVRAGARRYGAHDVAADPRFVDPAGNRYDVLAASPAVDSGVGGTLATIRGVGYSVPANDLLGGARTEPHDRGAYELGGGIGDPPVPATAPAPTPTTPAPAPAPAPAPTPAPAPAPAPSPTPTPTPTPTPAPPASTPQPKPKTAPRYKRPTRADRLRAALAACDSRRTRSARSRCRAAARARLGARRTSVRRA